MCYKARPNIVKDEKGDFATYSHSILGRWRNHFYQVFNVHDANDKTGIHVHTHTAEPLVPDPSVFEFEMTIKNSKGTNHQVLIKSQQK
jgi:hypothetical protein